MKIYLSLLYVCLLFSTVFAQKHDYYWPLGYASYDPLPEYGGSTIDFNFSPPEVYPEDRDMNFTFTCASICDTSGNLLFYTNGEFIANYLDEKIPNSDTLNPGELFEDETPYGYWVTQGAIIFPSPKENEGNIYYLFHVVGEKTTPELSTHASGLFYTLVDMGMNNGTGGILAKRIPVIQDTLLRGKLSATRHANGRDWWLLVAEHSTNNYYKVLLDTTGVHVVDTQAIGEPVHIWEGLGQSCFSPDGSKYARYNAISLDYGADLDIYDFDRCTGEMGNALHLNIIDSTFCAGLAFSPNSRFLYVSSTFHLYQFDLWAADISASKDTVAVYDGYTDPFPSVFWLAQLAPDGKIYIGSRTVGMVFHIVHQPDQKGDSCQVEQHGLHLSTRNAWTMPNFPNYRLSEVQPITPSFSFVQNGDTVFFQNTSIGGVKYEWDFGDGSMATGQQVQHVYAQPGSYVVSLTVGEGCFSELVSDTVLVSFTGTTEVVVKDDFIVFPSPANTELNLEFGPQERNGTLTVSDVFGRLTAIVKLPSNISSFVLNTSTWVGGVYVIRLSFDQDESLTQAVIVSH